MMVRLNKKDLQEICLWGTSYQAKCKENHVPFESDEINILIKVGIARDNAWKYQKGTFASNMKD